MNVEDVQRLQPLLINFLERFRNCFRYESQRRHFQTYIQGQFSDLRRKNVEAMALLHSVPPRNLQEFLAHCAWEHQLLCDTLQEIVAKEHGGPDTIGIIDETSAVKKGDKTPGVQRQYCGTVGKQENCIVTVHLAFARNDFHCLLNGDLFLPESWSNDRARCRAAGIPNDVVYRPKTEIALELYDQAVANGVTFDWLTFDEWYGSKPAFLGALVKARQPYVGEVHKNFVVWFSRPKVTYRPYRRRGRGRSRRTPRVTANSPKPHYVAWGLTHDRELVEQPWEPWYVKDTQKGPKIVEVKSKIVYPKGDDGLPMPAHRLLYVRDVLARDEIKYFVAYAPQAPSCEKSLVVGFSRWRVERCFQDDKGRVGMSDYEGRWYPGLIRHLILSAVSLLFLARMRALFQIDYGELTVRQMRLAVNALLKSIGQPPAIARQILEDASRIIRYHQRRNAQARASHVRTRNQNLEALGVDMATIRRCLWDTS